MSKLEKLMQVADEKHDGHFMLMKFTTNWRCCLGTVDDIMISTCYMAEGKTMEEAINNCLKNNINSIDVWSKAKKYHI